MRHPVYYVYFQLILLLLADVLFPEYWTINAPPPVGCE